jgi:hypothetical protein
MPRLRSPVTLLETKPKRFQEDTMKKVLEIGGFISGGILIVFGVVVIVLALGGRHTVNSSLAQQQIIGTPDMTPAGIKVEAQKAGLTATEIGSYPTCSVANVAVTNGTTARCFGEYMRIHALEASGGLYYSQMPEYATANGKGTNDATKALMAGGKPVQNAARDTWITETSLSTALNVSYMADQLSLFSLVVGFALLLTGFGFVILDFAALHRRRGASEATTRTAASVKATKPVVA